MSWTWDAVDTHVWATSSPRQARDLCHPSLRLLCYNSHTRSRPTLLCAAKRVPHHVLVTKMPRVMDGRAMSRGLCFTHGNPALQPSYLALVVAASLVHAPWCIWACLAASSPFIDASRSSHPLSAIATYLGMIMPFLVYLHLALLSSSFALPL
jgi:hypothetical protein